MPFWLKTGWYAVAVRAALDVANPALVEFWTSGVLQCIWMVISCLVCNFVTTKTSPSTCVCLFVCVLLWLVNTTTNLFVGLHTPKGWPHVDMWEVVTACTDSIWKKLALQMYFLWLA